VRPDELAERVRPRYPDVLVARGEAIAVVERDRIREALEELRADQEVRLDFLSDLTAADWPGRAPRFWLSYGMYSMEHRHRLRVKVGLPGEDPRIDSVVPLYPTADWLEREVFDLYGIVFEGHPDLRRILMPEGWEGHPLRKTEELGGVNTRYRGTFVPPVDRRIP